VRATVLQIFFGQNGTLNSGNHHVPEHPIGYRPLKRKWGLQTANTRIVVKESVSVHSQHALSKRLPKEASLLWCV